MEANSEPKSLDQDCPHCQELLLVIHAASKQLFPALAPKAQACLDAKIALLKRREIHGQAPGNSLR